MWHKSSARAGAASYGTLHLRDQSSLPARTMWSPFHEFDPSDEDNGLGPDPGKDLFALLAFMFFMISVILMQAAQQVAPPLPVDSITAGQASPTPPVPAAIRGGDQGVFVEQGNDIWHLPAEAADLASEAELQEVPGVPPVLIVDPPSTELSANEFVLAVQALNSAGVRVQFRPVAGAMESPQ